MIRVLHSLGELHPSGAERMLASAAALWPAAGIDSVVLGAGSNHPFADDLRSLGYRVVLVPSSRSVGGLAAFRAAVRTIVPDVVHLHAESMFAPMAVAARSCPSVHLVVRTVHSTRGSAPSSRFRRKRRRRLAVARAAGMQAYACGDEVADHERSAFGLDAAVIENWVDTAAFAAAPTAAEIARTRTELGIDPGRTMVTLVGNCAEAKNHELALAAVAAASGRMTLVHVGGTASQSVDEEGLAAKMSEHGRVVQLGRRDDVAQILAASDALAIPSRYEGFSVVASEALCAGVPLLAADSPGLRWLADFKTPKRLPLRVEAWAAALDKIVAGDRPRRECLDADRARALVRFSAARGVEQWAGVYRGAPGVAGRTSV